MAFPSTAFKQLSLIVLLAVAMVPRSFGQAVDSPIKFANQNPITVTLVEPPSLGPSNTPRGEAGLWLKIDFQYAVAPQGPTPFLDTVVFNIVVEGRDLYDSNAKTAEGVAVGLTGTETYVNIGANREVHGVFYIHPSAMVRFATKSGPRDFTNRFNIHIDALVNGKLADYANLKNDPQGLDWYKALRMTSGYVYRQDQCCFIVNDPSFYPELKLPPTQQ